MFAAFPSVLVSDETVWVTPLIVVVPELPVTGVPVVVPVVVFVVVEVPVVAGIGFLTLKV
jgi:hypothetical protein